MLPKPAARAGLGKVDVSGKPLAEIIRIRRFGIPKSTARCKRCGLCRLSLRVGEQNTRFEDAGRASALRGHLVREASGSTAGKLVGVDVPGAARTVPPPLAVIVLAPRFPIEIQDERIERNLFFTVRFHVAAHERLRRSPLAVQKP